MYFAMLIGNGEIKRAIGRLWSQKNQHTELTAGTCYVKWTRIARETTTNWPTLSVVHARITGTVVVVCIHIYLAVGKS